ncbi:MAG: type II toxin-antitoxin system HipA family toxin [Gammaproteobacteria bacterium]|nr:MAG: type II toxin-antitoxin system HipA family toxin [Gammaproteobacteria bacterium]
MSNNLGVIKLTLHNELVGYLIGFQNGKNILVFADEFKGNNHRSTFSLITHPAFPNSTKLMQKPWVKNQRLHPILSNLLPEGVLREFITQRLKVHIDNEFHIFSYLGEDLPGAIVAIPLTPEEVPDTLLSFISEDTGPNAKIIRFDTVSPERKFSLAGVQMKFSMREQDGRYNISNDSSLGNWIIKTPSTIHKDVPVNEYSAMTLASLAGVDIPEIRLVDLDKLDNLPQINLPAEKSAFAIKRFDRSENGRIHMEDFAQVLVKYPDEKYNSANYERIGRILYEFSGDALTDVQQFARRLLVNILLANGDAHLKNWSLLYADKVTPRLSPAYDIVTTRVYINGERNFALNLGKSKEWYKTSYLNFQLWAEKSGIPWRAIKPHLDDVMDKAKTLWPTAIKDLPMNEEHKAELIEHWGNLHKDFRL